MFEAKTQADLGWPALVEQLVSRCHTNRGAALAAAKQPAFDAGPERAAFEAV